MERITGDDLLSLHSKLQGEGKLLGEIVEAAGYVKPKKDGGMQRLFSDFKEALLAAKGVNLDRGNGKGEKRPGRDLSYQASVLKTGHVVVGAAYLRQIGLEHPGHVSISVSRGRLVLSPVEATS